jgi:hypothetical protein
MTSSIFDREAPPPLYKFRGEHRIDPNNALLSGQDAKKILSKEQYKRVKKIYQTLCKTLISKKIDEYLDEFKRLKGEYTQYRVEWLSLSEQAKETGITPALAEQGKIVKANMQSLYNDAKEIARILDPYRTDIRRRATLKKRLKEYEVWVEDEKIRDRLTREMELEAQYYANAIRVHWSRLGFNHTHVRRKKTITDVPTFERIIVTPDSLQYKIAISRQGLVPGSVVNLLPQGIEGWQLVSEKTINELNSALEVEITTPHIEHNWSGINGLWIEVHRVGLKDGLLSFIPYRDVMAHYDVDKAGEFPLPLGVRRGRHVNWIPLKKQPHILVTGQTGSGKSKAIDVIVSTLIDCHSPNDVRFIFFDLKEGIELGKYANIPHTLGLINDDIAQVAKVLTQLEAERKRRMLEIRKIPGVMDVDQYNEIVPAHLKMPRIVVVFDEFSTVASNKRWKSIIYELVTVLVQKGRSSNINFVIGAQTPYGDIVPSSIKAQMTLSLTGRQRTLGASMSSVGSKDASELEKIPGRMLCDDGMEFYPVQMPYISSEEITDIVANAQMYPKPDFALPELNPDLDETAPYPAVLAPLDEDRLAQVALRDFGGFMARDKIWALLNERGERVSKVTVQSIINAIRAKNTITVNGVVYQIKPHGKGAKIESLTDSPPESSNNAVSTNELSNKEDVI